jgi:hypothetical protein
VVLVNLVAVRVSIPVLLNATGFAARQITTLDQNTYRMDYNESSDSVALHRSGVARIGITGTLTNVTVSLDGYGVAVVKFVHLRPGHAPFIVPPSAKLRSPHPVVDQSSWGVPSSAVPPVGGLTLRSSVSSSPFLLPISAVVGSNGFVAAPSSPRRPTRDL